MDRFMGMGVLVAAVEEGSLAAAARRFGLSAAMAGKYVSAIESELNVRLLQRTTRRLSLTEAGQRYYERCKRILSDCEEADREASQNQSSVRGLLRIAAPVTFGALHLGAVLAHYLARHPQLSIETVLSDRYVDLLASGVDVALRIGRLPDSGLIARRLAPCRMAICAAPAYLERHGAPTDLDQLRAAARLSFSDAVSAGDWTLYDAHEQPHLIDGPCRLSSNNMQMLLDAALAGAGVAYGPTFVFAGEIARGRLIELLPAFLPGYHAGELTIQAVYPSARHLAPKVRHLLDYLGAAFGDRPPWDVLMAAGQGHAGPAR